MVFFICFVLLGLISKVLVSFIVVLVILFKINILGLFCLIVIYFLVIKFILLCKGVINVILVIKYMVVNFLNEKL